MISAARWQRTTRPLTVVGAGCSIRQRSSTNSQRGAKAQPAGRLCGRGGWPPIPASTSVPSSEGTASTRPRVYGCTGLPSTSCVVPSSMIRPEYITATSVTSWLTTARSWLTYTAATPYERQSARPSRERGAASTRRARSSARPARSARTAGECHRQSNALLLAAGELVRVPAQQVRVSVEADFLEHLEHSRVGVRCRPVVHGERFLSWLPTLSAGFSADAGSCGT